MLPSVERGGAADLSWAEARDAAEHPACTGWSSPDRIIVRSVSNAAIEKP